MPPVQRQGPQKNFPGSEEPGKFFCFPLRSTLDPDPWSWGRAVNKVRQRALLTPILIMGGTDHEADYQDQQDGGVSGEDFPGFECALLWRGH